MPRSASVAFVLLLLDGVVARAQAPCAETVTPKAVGPATSLANDAREAMAAGKFEAALQLYEGAFCLLPDPALKHGLSSAALNLGRCEEAVRDARFWADHAAPKDTKDAAEWKDQVLHLCAEVTVESTPAGAALFVDGAQQSIGSAPWHGWLKSGTHSVVGSLSGFSDASSTLVIPEALNPPQTVTLALSPKFAQGKATPEARRQEAVRLGHEATEAYKAGNYVLAFGQYEAAYKLVPAPPLVLNLSRTALKLGRCEDAESYALTYSAAFGASETAAIASPTTLLATVYEQCPEAQITSDPAGASLLIEGVPRSNAFVTPWKGRLPVGKRILHARLQGFAEQRVELDVRATTPSQLHLTFVTPLAVAPVAPVAPPPVVNITPQLVQVPRAELPRSAPIRWAPFVAAGVADIGLVLAIAGGVEASKCPTRVATPQAIGSAEQCQYNNAGLADAGWALAGAGTVTAAVLWFVLKPASTEAAPPVRVSIANGVSLMGRF